MGKILINREELTRRVSLPLYDKIKWAIERYLDYLDIYHNEGVYISFSGGKDSQVLADIIDRLHAGEMIQYLEKEYLFFYKLYVKDKPAPPKVFCDTGLEFPEIRTHVKKFENVTWLKPKMNWVDVVQNVGFLIGSKKVSRMITDIRNPKATNLQSRTLYLTGIKSDGTKSKSFKLANIWRKLIDADLKNIRFADVYYERDIEFLEDDGQLTIVRVEGEKRTGCMFCLIGQPKQIERRIDRLRITHNKQWKFLMDGKIGMRNVLEYIGIKTKLF